MMRAKAFAEGQGVLAFPAVIDLDQIPECLKVVNMREALLLPVIPGSALEDERATVPQEPSAIALSPDRHGGARFGIGLRH
jgi:hypothetical protein